MPLAQRIGQTDLATRLREAIQATLLGPKDTLTGDLGGTGMTRDISAAIKDNLSA